MTVNERSNQVRSVMFITCLHADNLSQTGGRSTRASVGMEEVAPLLALHETRGRLPPIMLTRGRQLVLGSQRRGPQTACKTIDIFSGKVLDVTQPRMYVIDHFGRVWAF